MENTSLADTQTEVPAPVEIRPETWLTSNDPTQRLAAVGMHLTPGVITVDNMDAFLACLDRCHGEPDTLTIGAFIIGAFEPPLCCDAADQRMVGFLSREDKSPLRLAAAHGLFRQKRLPEAAHLAHALTTDVTGKHRPKSVPPHPHGLMAEVYPALEQQVLDIPQ